MKSPQRTRRVYPSMPLDPPISFGKHSLAQSVQLRIVLIDQHTLIKLTPIEFRLFSSLLARPRTLVSSQELAFQALQTKGLYDKHMGVSVIRHIYALRSKLRHSGLSIRRVVSSGWLLTDEETEEPESIQQTMT